MPSREEDEALKLAQAAAAASDRVFRGAPPIAADGAPQKGGGRPDWNCPKCGDLQFGRNATCRRCGTPNPSGPPGGKGNRVGDWICPSCSDFQYARNAQCRRCGAPNPGGGPAQARRPGDWECPACHDVVFARNLVCRRCQTPNPSAGAGAGPSPLGGGHHRGDVTEEPWRCPSCGQFVFPHFSSCLSCQTPRPAHAERMAPVPQTFHAMPGASGPVGGYMPQLEDGGHGALRAAAAMAEQQLLSRAGAGRHRERSRSPIDMGPMDGN